MNIFDLYEPDAASPRLVDELEGRESFWEQGDDYRQWSKEVHEERKRWEKNKVHHCFRCYGKIDLLPLPPGSWLTVTAVDHGTMTPHKFTCWENQEKWRRRFD